MSADLVFLHTSPVHVPTFSALLERAAPQLRAVHLVDEALLSQARRIGATHPDVQHDVQSAVRAAAASTGAPLVVCTCSTLGGAAEATPTGGAFVAARIDRAMADRAAQLGPEVLVVAALESTLQPTSDLVADSAARLQRPVRVQTLLVAEAWAHFERGDSAAYLDAVAQAVRAALPGPDVVVLAQASMAPAVALLGGVGVEVLASPLLGVQSAVDRLARLGTT